MEEAEWKILPAAIDLIANGKVSVQDGAVVKQHFFTVSVVVSGPGVSNL